MKYSASKENYLKAVFHLQQAQGMVSTNSLAAALQTRAASVTDMLKKLKSQKLLQYERYKGVKLTAEGKKLAVHIVRKHRLWEYFLVDKLGFGWEEVHEMAEELEHISSQKLIDRLEEYLDFPDTDPHGDPIPDNRGRMRVSKAVQLCELPVQTACTISHVGNQSVEMIELLNHLRLTIKTRLEIKRKFGFDQSLEVQLPDGSLITISQSLSSSLYVNPEKNDQSHE